MCILRLPVRPGSHHAAESGCARSGAASAPTSAPPNSPPAGLLKARTGPRASITNAAYSEVSSAAFRQKTSVASSMRQQRQPAPLVRDVQHTRIWVTRSWSPTRITVAGARRRSRR